ncbi:hypothetical protein HWV62_6227 [Athelia sp. TMB]|nr:hypothetical protein HWV62_6227 [Athelia sp. TMB]
MQPRRPAVNPATQNEVIRRNQQAASGAPVTGEQTLYPSTDLWIEAKVWRDITQDVSIGREYSKGSSQPISIPNVQFYNLSHNGIKGYLQNRCYKAFVAANQANNKKGAEEAAHVWKFIKTRLQPSDALRYATASTIDVGGDGRYGVIGKNHDNTQDFPINDLWTAIGKLKSSFHPLLLRYAPPGYVISKYALEPPLEQYRQEYVKLLIAQFSTWCQTLAFFCCSDVWHEKDLTIRENFIKVKLPITVCVSFVKIDEGPYIPAVFLSLPKPGLLSVPGQIQDEKRSAKEKLQLLRKEHLGKYLGRVLGTSVIQQQHAAFNQDIAYDYGHCAENSAWL